MAEPQTSSVSQENTQETILEKENNSEVTMNRPQTSTEPADPSASGESTTKAESENQLRLFVTLLTARLLIKCHALRNHSQEKGIAHLKNLVNQTMVGLAVTEGYCPDVKSTKKVCKAVLKDLEKKFFSRKLLESVITSEDPAVDAAIVKSLQDHVKDFSSRSAKKDAPGSWWKTTLQVTACIAGFLAAVFLLILIP